MTPRRQPPKAFRDKVKARALSHYGYKYEDDEFDMVLVSYYDSFTVFAQVLNETVVAGQDPTNGTAIAHRIWNRTYAGIAGDITVNAYGHMNSHLSVYDLDPVSGLFKKIGDYQEETDVYKPVPGAHIHWPLSNGPPSDEPKCGFNDDKCEESRSLTRTQIIGLSAAFGVLVAITFIIVFIAICRSRMRAEAELWWWKIDKDDIGFMDGNRTDGSAFSFASKISLLSGKADAVLDPNNRRATYKGQNVRLRALNINDLVVDRELLMEFKQAVMKKSEVVTLRL